METELLQEDVVEEDGKGAYKVCPECGKKCYYFQYGSCEDDYACGCTGCSLLLAE